MNYTNVQFPGLGINIDISPVAFSIGSFQVYWYGIIIAVAMLLAIFLGIKDSKKLNFPTSLIYDFILVAIPSGIVGARLYFVLFNLDYYMQDWSRIIDTRSGGLAIYGGVLGAALGTYIMCKIRKISFTAMGDYVIVYVPLAQAIGRWGNFFNQEAFGTTTNLPWGMTSSTISTYLAANCPYLDSTSPVHPTFLYESIADLLLFIILVIVRKKSKFAFETVCVYFIGYGFARFFIEGLRTDSLYIPNTAIRVSQLLSLVLCVVCLIYIVYIHAQRIRKRKFPARFYATEGAAEQAK
ncbi:MAG: prolipoprotein diacylglyceryl transferase [Clostridiales bacterium]|nr:prolipoprotein diacylglyceryl transferase [Clostridiales bacterium]